MKLLLPGSTVESPNTKSADTDFEELLVGALFFRPPPCVRAWDLEKNVGKWRRKKMNRAKWEKRSRWFMSVCGGNGNGGIENVKIKLNHEWRNWVSPVFIGTFFFFLLICFYDQSTLLDGFLIYWKLVLIYLITVEY